MGKKIGIIGAPDLDPARVLTVSPELRAARCVPDLRAALDAGVTSVRELGGLGVHLAPAVAEGSIEGPAIYASGAVLSTTGGHGDLHSLPIHWVSELSDFRLADGADECVRATREQLRKNAKVIKICASGGVLSEVDHPIHQQFTVAEMRAIVEVAAMAERVVAAHCHGKPGMMAAIEAGVRTIEHGTYLDEEVADAMRETGTVLVATCTVIDELMTAGGLLPMLMDKLKAVAEVHAGAVALAHSRGVRLATGTDIYVSGRGKPNSWGRNGRELAHLVGCGLSPLEAIRAATAHGPLTLGAQAPRSGVLAEGYDADVITLDADPLADITVMSDPDHVTGVWKAGRRVKGA
ncbi:metal-dependent hydrolase family protein [Nonomuraea dietziae]|uniref:metal-dependent hydrolase family protein n=1 Tax=Nonomuraea dietziae TaxID=65515 RepID=UPI0033F1A0DF